MYPHENVIIPSQSAANGALDIFIDGFRQDNCRAMTVGLKVLQSATDAQIQVAMDVLQSRRRATVPEILGMFAAPGVSMA